MDWREMKIRGIDPKISSRVLRVSFCFRLDWLEKVLGSCPLRDLLRRNNSFLDLQIKIQLESGQAELLRRGKSRLRNASQGSPLPAPNGSHNNESSSRHNGPSREFKLPRHHHHKLTNWPRNSPTPIRIPHPHSRI